MKIKLEWEKKMNYLKKYGITQEEIMELEEVYNENIIKFIKENDMFITEKLEYLKKENYIIYPILKNNIRIFLEMMSVLERKIATMKEKGFSLVPSKYIEFVNRDENIDYDTKMRELQAELTDLLKQEEQSKQDLLAVFKELGYEIKL